MKGPLALMVLGLLLASCNILQDTFGVNVQVEVDLFASSYTVGSEPTTLDLGTVIVRAPGVPDGTVARVRLVNPPAGVSLEGGSLSLNLRGGEGEGRLRVRVEPITLLGNAPSRSVELTLQVAVQGTNPVERRATFTVARQGGGGGQGPGPTPSLEARVILSRLAVFPGEEVPGVVEIRAQGAAQGLVVVSLATDCLPEGAIRPQDPLAGSLVDGLFRVRFTLRVPEESQPRLCTVTANILGERGLQAQGSAQFEILRRPEPPRQPSLEVRVTLSRLAVFPGEEVQGLVEVRAGGGAQGLVAVSLATDCLPDGAISARGPLAGPLLDGVFRVPFTVRVPDTARPGLCTITANVQGERGLQAQAQAQFDILRRSEPPRQPSLEARVTLNRLAVLPGDEIEGLVEVRAGGGAQGLVAVSLGSDCLPDGAIRPRGPLAGPLSGGTFRVSFTVSVPERSRPGLCTVTASVQGEGGLQAQAQAQFDIVARSEIALSLGSVPPVLQGQNTVSVPFTLTPSGGYTGLVELNLWSVGGNGAMTLLTSSTDPTYAVVVGNNLFFPNAQGQVFLPVSGEVQGYLVLTTPGGWNAGQYGFTVRAIGPNVVWGGFSFQVIAPPNPNP